jgi:hypothetical protein
MQVTPANIHIGIDTRSGAPVANPGGRRGYRSAVDQNSSRSLAMGKGNGS